MSPEQAASPLAQFPIIPYVLILLVFYFLMIKPQKDKQKEHKNLLTNLKKNDQIVTTGGIHGTVTLVKDTTVVVRVDDNAKIEIDKEAVASVVKTNS